MPPMPNLVKSTRVLPATYLPTVVQLIVQIYQEKIFKNRNAMLSVCDWK